MPIRFVKDLDTGMVLGQYCGEAVFEWIDGKPAFGVENSTGFGIEEIEQAEKVLKGRYGIERVFCYLHQDGTKEWVSEKNHKVIGGFRHHKHFK